MTLRASFRTTIPLSSGPVKSRNTGTSSAAAIERRTTIDGYATPRSTLLRKLRVIPTRAASPVRVRPRSVRSDLIRRPSWSSRATEEGRPVVSVADAARFLDPVNEMVPQSRPTAEGAGSAPCLRAR